MTYYGGKDLAYSFRQVRDNTIQIAEDIPEAKYSFQAAPDARSIGQLLTHIALGPGIQMHIHGSKIADLKVVNFPELMQNAGAEEATPRTKADIVALLKSEGGKVGSYLESLSDAFLAEPVTMPGGMEPATKTRFEMLMSMKEHEMHHRGQLMLLQRMIGIVPHLTRRMQERMAQRAAAAGAGAQAR
jgi:uncharacterized damage-inducible protein DinB